MYYNNYHDRWQSHETSIHSGVSHYPETQLIPISTKSETEVIIWLMKAC